MTSTRSGPNIGELPTLAAGCQWVIRVNADVPAPLSRVVRISYAAKAQRRPVHRGPGNVPTGGPSSQAGVPVNLDAWRGDLLNEPQTSVGTLEVGLREPEVLIALDQDSPGVPAEEP